MHIWQVIIEFANRALHKELAWNGFQLFAIGRCEYYQSFILIHFFVLLIFLTLFLSNNYYLGLRCYNTNTITTIKFLEKGTLKLTNQ